MRLFLTFLLVNASIIIITSCEREKTDVLSPYSSKTIELTSPSDFLYNIPIKGDTIFMDYDNGSDFRVDLDDYSITLVKITIDGLYTCRSIKPIINTSSIFHFIGTSSIEFSIWAMNLQTGDGVAFNSKKFILKMGKNMSARFMKVLPSEGRLKISWPSMDKKHLKNFLVERIVGENQEYIYSFKQSDTTWIDPYYVGENVIYRISLIDDQDEILRNWSYHKESELPQYYISTASDKGYDFHFSRCRYYNNFGQYYLTTGSNFDNNVLFTSQDISDTVYHFTNRKFGADAFFWLQNLPHDFPEGITQQNIHVYGNYLTSVCGDKSFLFDYIAKAKGNNIIYIYDGAIYSYNYDSGQLNGSINNSAFYIFLNTTPSGEYVYAENEKIANSPIYIWPSSDLTVSPEIFKIDGLAPRVSDNLVAIVRLSDKWSICDVSSDSVLYTTDYTDQDKPKISSDGKYFLIDNRFLKLFSFENDTIHIIWTNTNSAKHYRFYDFDPYKPLCYIWDEAGKFSINKISDFSEVASYQLNAERIVNIDYENGRLMCISGDLQVYNLADGSLIENIPADLYELFLKGHQCLLIGDYVYAYNGVKYKISN